MSKSLFSDFIRQRLGGVVMLSRKLVPAVLSLVVVAGLLTFLSCDIDAKQQKPVQSAKKASRTSKCCKAGFFYCPTAGENGCDCCGASVKGTLADYKNKEGKLKIDGLDEQVPFIVASNNSSVDNALAKMVGQTGQFVLKLKPYEYELDPNNKPHGKSNLTHWYGMPYECEELGDNNGKMQDRTEEFVEGWKISSAVIELQARLEGLVPKYDPERPQDKRKN